MKSQYNQTKLVNNLRNYREVLENSFSSMTAEEIRQCKPKSRLESFIRRKALQTK